MSKFLSALLVMALGFTMFAAWPTLPVYAAEPHAGMLRFPDVSASHVVFRYANDLWLVPKEGGTAIPLASPPGQESFPRFSPDGKTIAFVGNYDGNYDLYTIPISGGTPFRVTHHPTREVLTDWTPDGRALIFCAFGMADYMTTYEMFTVPTSGGLPEKLPIPYGLYGRISDDGTWLAYTPFARDNATWKRYRGGMASDIWLFNLKNFKSKKITDWEGTDSQPMWQGNKVYYLCDDGPSHRLNIWVYDTEKEKRRQVTQYKDYDVKWPSIGPGSNGQGEIVFQYGPELRLLDLTTEKARTVKITIPGDKPRVRVQSVDVSAFVVNGDISSTGQRVVLEARGDIWTLPAKKGSPINLTRTSGVAEREPAWSPDKKWIAYFSDASGEYQLCIRKSDGSGEEKTLTNRSSGFLSHLKWSPDSKWLSFWDENCTFFIYNVEKGETRTVAHNETQWQQGYSWSSDSGWLAIALQESLVRPSVIWLYNVEKQEKHPVSSGVFGDVWPAFDRDGKYLYYVSLMDFTSPTYEDIGSTWVYTNTGRLCAVPLSADSLSPVAPKIDEEKWEEEKDGKGDKDEGDKKSDKEDKSAEKDKKKSEPLRIDLEGFEHRTVLLPVERGRFSNLCVNNEGKLIYARRPPETGDDEEFTRFDIHLLDLDDDKEKEKTVVSGVSGFTISSDGKKLVVRKERTLAIIDAKPDQKMETTISMSGMRADIDPKEEWRQLFRDAWRIERDYFYAPNMHGVDWKAVRKQYEAMLDDCASREDVSYVISEMISELNVGHAYYFEGESETGPNLSVGMLGCDFELSNGAYRISRILEGGPWDADAKGPLSQPGLKVKVGDYVLAVNGVPIGTAKDPWASFQGLGGRTVTLTVSEEPKMTDKARQLVVELLSSDNRIRYRAWVEKNRRYVEKKSNGKVGYMYIPDTSIPGQNELVRQFFGQLHKEALIVDERWNGGGQMPTRFVELLSRPISNYFAVRYTDKDPAWPLDAHFGPKCMLINGLAGSGGDHFPYWFRKAGVGKLVGTRTWGGLVGMSGNPNLIDGAAVTVPRFAFYEPDGTWGIEGHGVDPDIEVVDDPALMVDGSDPQLDAAIDLMLEEIARNPYRAPARPSYPDRSGMGIREEDK